MYVQGTCICMKMKSEGGAYNVCECMYNVCECMYNVCECMYVQCM